MAKTINTRIKQKTDTLANWTAKGSFVPLTGEIIVFSDINKIKIGDGNHSISALPFIDCDTVDGKHSYDLVASSGNITSGGFNRYSSVSKGNTNVFPYNKIAHYQGTGSWIDAAALLYITGDYKNGGFGLLRIVLRSNDQTATTSGYPYCDCEAEWLTRVGIATSQVIIAYKNTKNAWSADVFLQTTGAYQSFTISQFEAGQRGAIVSTAWTLLSTVEKNNSTTSSTDNTNCYVSIAAAGTYTNQVQSVDAAVVDRALKDADGNTISSTYLKRSGGTMTGALTANAGQVYSSNAYGIDMKNSDIINLNSIYTADLANNTSEGIRFIRTNGNYDSLTASDGTLYFMANDPKAGTAFTNAQQIATIADLSGKQDTLNADTSCTIGSISCNNIQPNMKNVGTIGSSAMPYLSVYSNNFVVSTTSSSTTYGSSGITYGAYTLSFPTHSGALLTNKNYPLTYALASSTSTTPSDRSFIMTSSSNINALYKCRCVITPCYYSSSVTKLRVTYHIAFRTNASVSSCGFYIYDSNIYNRTGFSTSNSNSLLSGQISTNIACTTRLVLGAYQGKHISATCYFSSSSQKTVYVTIDVDPTP